MFSRDLHLWLDLTSGVPGELTFSTYAFLRGFRPALLTASFVLSLSLGLVLLAR